MPVVPRFPRLTPDMRRLTVIMVPALLAGGVVQINLIVGRQVGSFFDGAVAWLSYADRLYQLPLGVVGIAIGIVLLPDLSRRLKSGDGSGGRDAINRATELTLALTLPAAVALLVIPLPIVTVLFERGAFGPADSWPTALAVAVYGAGLPAFVMQKVLSPLYYAREDTRSPFRFAVWAMVVNAAVALGLAPFIGFIAAALGTTVAGWVMIVQLWAGTRPMGDAAAPDARLRRAVPRIALACLAMGIVLWFAARVLAGPLAEPALRYAGPRRPRRLRLRRLLRRRPRLRRHPPRRPPRRPPPLAHGERVARGAAPRNVPAIRCRHRPLSRDPAYRLFLTGTSPSASWCAVPSFHPSAPGSGCGADRARSTRSAFTSAVLMPSAASRASTSSGRTWPSAVKPIINCGMPVGSAESLSTCQVCHVFP